VKSSAIYTPNAYEVICRIARMADYHADRLRILSEKHTNLPAVLSFDGIKPNKMWGWEGGNLFSLYPNIVEILLKLFSGS
jgi:hypothetical protein